MAVEGEQARERAEAAAAAYEAALGDARGDRRARGAFYTPPELVDWILDRALTSPSHRVLDPACGTGHFLVAAARRLGDVRAVHGSDLDAEAVRLARARLAALDPTVPAEEIAARVRVADGLEAWSGERFDAVVGNPPFLGQLRRRTAGRTGGLGAYTDTSAAFLHRSLSLVEAGGVVALVQPLSVLAARDAGPVRAEVAERGAVVDFWCHDRPVFEGTPVLTCVPVVRIGATGGVAPEGWGALAAPAFGIPPVQLPADTGVLGDVATCTADFRDQYYGLRPYVRDAGPGEVAVPPAGHAPLVTSGLIDPAESRWGSVPTRFARTPYDAPLVDLDALRAGADETGADGALARWADARLVPKVLVAAQGRVVEAVADVEGCWLPSVPVLTAVPRERDADALWRLLALTLAPPVVADAAARYLGTGLTPGSIKVSARQLTAFPLPSDRRAWSEAAGLARAAQAAGPEERPGALAAVGAAMTRAYGLDPRGDGEEVLSWWLGRLARADRRSTVRGDG
ncbi:N-6 DNA methylase [Nocardioides sp. GY 10113]|uniref:HsdM family class I SAM-dependent methyltransferase n=1 Tax=Nocardioides sp. GY 10113 TaxID=2569761 RepID=UPI0014589CC8|nr:N-6 DNA methylase [Nocardioides sp. GY 10113]